MSSSSSPMDYQKPVKVKSRWTQSCQMEMMMEESQSSLDMSDTITDVSTSDLNESTDHSFELNSLELRRSRRIGSNRTDYRQLNGLKAIRQKKSVNSKTSIKIRKKRQSIVLKTSDMCKEDQFKDSIPKEPIIIHPTIDWNNIKMSQSIGLSKSVNYICEDIEKLPKKPIRRSSLSWKFKFTPLNKVNDINGKSKCYNLSNAIQNLSIKKMQLETKSLPTGNEILCENNKIIHKGYTNENTSQQLCYSDIDINNISNFDESNEKLHTVELHEISATNSNKPTQSIELSMHLNHSFEDKTYMNLPVKPKLSTSKLENLRCNPIYKPRKIRSKSLDSVLIKTHNTLKRFKSFDDVNNKLGHYMVDTFKLQKPKKKILNKRRRQSKRIKPKNNHVEILDDMKVPEVNYDQVADEMYREHENQLFKARMVDKEFDQKLKSTNFKLINENLYRPNRQTLKLHSPSDIPALRKLKQRVISGDINDYCECTLSKEDINEGITGCDDRCLNRLLKVECASGCSLKRYCTNKQFQNKQFKKTNIIKTENKGYGICAIEDIPKGVLINEYVGEVIDYNEMCSRLRKEEYKNLNYMVQLNSDEIIDSTSKGNVTRFINHSCDPNSVGEKWYVLGQSRIGFFSTQHIKKGEEITFDYSFQVFGDGAQICYCGSPKCRGYISKASQITDLSSSEDSSDGVTENQCISKPEEKQRNIRIFKKRIIYNDKNKLRELSRQLTEIARLKTGLKADQEMATLNLNRLMVHITDSVSRLHVLKFIQEHDMNKRLFMDFSGLSIIHNWMTSNENESFKLMILEILAELPITNRNTITKSKVLDVVAEWAEIPQDVKSKIESLENPALELITQSQEIDNILSKNNDDNEIKNGLIEKARALWKKWIVLKMVFKIPKKIDQHKPIETISSKLVEDTYPSMDITVLDQKISRISNKYANKVRSQQYVSSERKKLRKEFELKVEQERQQIFRKKVMDNWLEQREGIVKKKPDQNCLQHQPPLSFLTNDNLILNHNNGIIKQTRWDCSFRMPHINQHSIPNHSMKIPCLNFMTPQALQQPTNQFLQYSQPQIFPNYHSVNELPCFNIPPPPLPNQSIITQPQKYTTILKKPTSQNIVLSSDLSPTRRLLKSADKNVFDLINDSLHKHYTLNKNKNVTTDNLNLSKTEHSIKSCTRVVQSGVDLLARVKVVSQSYKKQPSKLIEIDYLKRKNDRSKMNKIPTLDLKLKSACDKNKRIIFINEKAGVTSTILNDDLVPIPKMVPLSQNNKFANAIFNSLLKKINFEKENSIPTNFVVNNFNADIATYDGTDKEIELYKYMQPKVIKKSVASVKTKSGLVTVMKRQWGMKLKGLKGNAEIPATKRNLMRKGNIHRLALKKSPVNITKSALKRRNSFHLDDYLKKPKEKRVTFLIEGEILTHSEVRPINLNQSCVKQKPLMKCHPFEIRNEPKSILQPSTSAIQGDNLQFPLFEESLETTNDQIIKPIVSKFKALRNKRKGKLACLEKLQIQRKHVIPVSMMSLSMEVLKLIPDDKKEMKKVIDFYHSMATIIVKTLGSYAKKTCQQGRIRSNEDFKYLAKKINENVLMKELQFRDAHRLKISNSTKDKVADYIKTYMSRFGEVFKRKSKDPTKYQKTN